MAQALDCVCKNGKPNAMRQGKIFLDKLQSPVTVQFIGVAPTQVWTGAVTGLVYKFGGAVDRQCVDSRDLQELLSKRKNGSPLFRVVRGQAPAEVVTVAAVAQASNDDDSDPAADLERELANRTPAPVTLDTIAEEIALLKGIGSATANKLASGGYTLAQLHDMDSANDTLVDEIAKNCNLARAMVIRVIEEANQWQYVESATGK